MLHLLAEGISNKSIARELGIAEATVKVHLKHLFQKFRFVNRTQAALWAQQNLKGQERPRPQSAPEGGARPVSPVQAKRYRTHDRSSAEKPTTDMAILPVPDYGRERMMAGSPLMKKHGRADLFYHADQRRKQAGKETFIRESRRTVRNLRLLNSKRNFDDPRFARFRRRSASIGSILRILPTMSPLALRPKIPSGSR